MLHCWNPASRYTTALCSEQPFLGHAHASQGSFAGLTARARVLWMRYCDICPFLSSGALLYHITFGRDPSPNAPTHLALLCRDLVQTKDDARDGNEHPGE